MKKWNRIAAVLLSFVLVLTSGILTGFSTQRVKAAGNTGNAPDHSKWVEKNEDGSYTLSLNVKGYEENQSVVTPADIILVVDESASMKWRMNSDYAASRGDSRIDKVNEVVEDLTEKLLPNNGRGGGIIGLHL